MASPSVLHAATGPVCRVTIDGSGAADGSRWSQAMPLQTALGTTACTELWIAEGIYTPTVAGAPQFQDRMHTFNIRPGIALYGGFAGTEARRSQRDFTTHRAILSGDIGVPGVNNDNSFRVVSMDGTTPAGTITASTVLDGFTIRDGRGSDTQFNINRGAGLHCYGYGSGSECSPTLRNLAFIQNSTVNLAGAVYNDGRDGGRSSPTFSNVTFSGNSATFEGGAMVNDAQGGGTSSPLLGNVTFNGNTAANLGGAMVNSARTGGNASPTLVNVTFSGNSAGNYGGAMYNSGGFTGDLGTSAPTLINVIVWDNPAAFVGGIFNYFQSSTIITSSIIQGGCPNGGQCTNLVAGDPQLAALADNGGSMQTIATAAGSPAVDAGNDADCSLSPVDGQDQRGAVRPQGAHCDIGAVEYFPGNYVVVEFIFSDGLESP
jgi:hypothetical protein